MPRTQARPARFNFADRPTMAVYVTAAQVTRHDRWNPGYFDRRYQKVEQRLRRLGARPLGDFIPEVLPDGSKGITYGQVGARILSPRGGVRYLQVINLRDTGIDFAIKPDRVAEGSHNDPPRSRVRQGDILFTNNAFRGTDTLLGRCVVVTSDYGKVNISQHIDRIRVVGINPFYVCCFLKSRFGSYQIQRMMHGVDSTGISFDRIRSVRIPVLPEKLQRTIERQYLAMSRCHDQAMAIKERLLKQSGIDPGQFGEAINSLANEDPVYQITFAEAEERLAHLTDHLEAVIEGSEKDIPPHRS
jgi:hypothetical protein